jgi:hypothetical protein
VGLSDYGPRRVPGLRGEEVAVLAGVSVPYHTRLERGDLAGASDIGIGTGGAALELADRYPAAAGSSPDRLHRSPCKRGSLRALSGAAHVLAGVVKSRSSVRTLRRRVVAPAGRRAGRRAITTTLPASVSSGASSRANWLEAMCVRISVAWRASSKRVRRDVERGGDAWLRMRLTWAMSVSRQVVSIS